jgi:hypothetical protein
MKRVHLILVVLLVLQVILGVIVFWPRNAATAAGEPVFPGIDTDSIVALTITDDQRRSVSLRKSTGEWVLPDFEDFPAQSDRIDPLLESIAGLSSGRLVTRTATSHKQLQVDPNEYQRRIEFETSDGENHVFYLGSSPSYGATHFRVSDKNETYLTDDLSSYDANATATSWISTSYVSTPQEEITGYVLQNANGTFTFSMDSEGKWSMEGLSADETVDDARVGAAVRQAATVSMSGPLGKTAQPSYGLEHPQAVATIYFADGVATLAVGAKYPGDNTYAAKSSESPYYVRLTEYTGDQLVTKTRDDFLQVPPTPEPTSG